MPFFRGDRGSHVYDRIAIVRCPNIVPVAKRDPGLREKIWKERNVIVSTAIRYYWNTVQHNYRFTESRQMEVEREQYTLVNNSILSFVKEYCTIGKGRTKRSEFNKLYECFCDANHMRTERQKDRDPQLFEQFGIEPIKTSGEFYYNLTINTATLADFGITLSSWSRHLGKKGK